MVIEVSLQIWPEAKASFMKVKLTPGKLEMVGIFPILSNELCKQCMTVFQ
jgi:hypothetical protein